MYSGQHSVLPGAETTNVPRAAQTGRDGRQGLQGCAIFRVGVNLSQGYTHRACAALLGLNHGAEGGGIMLSVPLPPVPKLGTELRGPGGCHLESVMGITPVRWGEMG